MNEITERDEWTFMVKHPCGEIVTIYKNIALNRSYENGISLNKYLLMLDCPTHPDVLTRLQMSSDEDFLKTWQWHFEEFLCVILKEYIERRISELTS